MVHRPRLWALVLTGLMAFTPRAFAQCHLGKLAELPVTMSSDRPVIHATLNGQDAPFAVDSGAFYSMITHANADKYGLPLTTPPFGFQLQGFSGEADTKIGTAKTFGLARYDLKDVEFLVGGNEIGGGAIGLIGQNVLRVGDVEYDLANGLIRLFRTDHCGKLPLAYWVRPNQDFSFINIEDTTAGQPHTRGYVYVNGVKVLAVFDTGSPISVISHRSAHWAGIETNSPGVTPTVPLGGIGQGWIPAWTATFQSFKIGDEEIKNSRLMVADFDPKNYDMLIGADFFLSHHIYVANSQGRLYFSYNGGPVFGLPMSRPQATAAVGGPADPADEPKDAAGYSRRGAAALERGEFDQALSDLSKAIALDPSQADYWIQRAEAYMARGEAPKALADVEMALTQKPDDLAALVWRARFRINKGDQTGALADLGAADHLAAKQDDIRFPMAQIYDQAGDLTAALSQYDLWIAEHADDNRLAMARNGRCWVRAEMNTDLDKALADCNAAIRQSPQASQFLDSRGMVRLRLGQFAKSIADYDAALKLNPKQAWSLYGRGLAKLRLGQSADGAADIAAAKVLESPSS